VCGAADQILADVGNQAIILAQLQAKQEEILKKAHAEIDRKVETFKRSVVEIVKAGNEEFLVSTLKYIEQTYQGLNPKAKTALTKVWTEEFAVTKEAEIQVIVDKFKEDLYSDEGARMHDLLGQTATFLYDSLASALQKILRDLQRDT